MPRERTGARRASHQELAHGLGRDAGEVAFREGGGDGTDVGRGFQAHFDVGFSDGDAITVLEGDGRVLPKRALLRSFALFPAATLFAVHVGAVHASEIAQGSHGRAGFEEKMMAGYLRVAGHAEVAIVHPAEQEGIMLG